MNGALKIRYQVAIAGQVTDTYTKAAIAMVQVRIIDAPEAFITSLITKAKLVKLADEPSSVVEARITLNVTDASNTIKLEAAAKIVDFLIARGAIKISPQHYVTKTAADGLFYFLDLPEGDYTLIASMPNSQRRYGVSQGKNVTVSRNDQDDIAISVADITLPSTSIIGKISSTIEASDEPIMLAEVRIKGSQDSTFSDSKGEYILSKLEASVRERTVIVQAQGYQDTQRTIALSEPGEQKILDFELTPLNKLLQRS